MPAPLIWKTHGCDEACADALARELKISPVVARLLAIRGLGNLNDASRFLNPSLAHLHDPMRLAGMQAAVDRLMRAIPPIDSIELHEAQECLVDERRRRDAAVATVARQARAGDTVQLAFDERHQLMQRLLVALPPGSEERRHVVAVPGHRRA